MKHPKQAFGIHEDGIYVKFAHLVNTGNALFLQTLERIELEAPLYRQPDEQPGSPPADNPWEQDTTPDDVQDFALRTADTGIDAVYQIQPCVQLLSRFDLKQGVIALNVNNDNLIINPDGSLPSKKAIKQFVKSVIPAEDYKKGKWDPLTLSINGKPQLWVHHGTNQLLEILFEYRAKMRASMFFQLADANDIALTDFFRICQPPGDSVSGPQTADSGFRTILVYIGHDYRRIFVFESGHPDSGGDAAPREISSTVTLRWVDTFPLQITQPNPSPEIIYSKLSLVLDEAQLDSIRRICFCGDFATSEVVDYVQSQYEDVAVEFFVFNQSPVLAPRPPDAGLPIALDEEKTLIWDRQFLAQYVMPIALAYKALHPDLPIFTRSNFLPLRVVEGQKVFKIAWHGFIVLGILFILTSLGTYRVLAANFDLIKSKRILKQRGEDLIKMKQAALEIDRINEEISSQQQSLIVIRGLLDGKNQWTALLSTLMTEMNARPLTWLTNLRKEGSGILISGITNRRDNVVSLANVLPLSKINKVVHREIRERSFWSFEILASLPPIDWIGMMEKELEDLSSPSAPSQPVGALSFRAPSAPSQPSQPRSDKPPDSGPRAPIHFGIRPIDEQFLLRPDDAMLPANRPDVRAYWQFIDSVRKGNMWAFQDKGAAFLKDHPDSPLLPVVRWRLAYRYYLDRQPDLARQFLSPMLQEMDQNLPYALFLAGRIALAKGDPRYQDHYRSLLRDHANHLLSKQVTQDLAELNK